MAAGVQDWRSARGRATVDVVRQAPATWAAVSALHLGGGELAHLLRGQRLDLAARQARRPLLVLSAASWPAESAATVSRALRPANGAEAESAATCAVDSARMSSASRAAGLRGAEAGDLRGRERRDLWRTTAPRSADGAHARTARSGPAPRSALADRPASTGPPPARQSPWLLIAAIGPRSRRSRCRPRIERGELRWRSAP
jgi:hypothetical protein